MKLRKYEHACFTLERDGKVLVVDPGDLTTNLPLLNNVLAVIVTHKHGDHFDANNIRNIVKNNPDLILFATPDVAEMAVDIKANSIDSNREIEIGPFNLKFLIGDHQKPFEDSPRIANLAVTINDTVYHAGDSFMIPDKPIPVLLLPVSGSWMKASMSRDFLFAVKPAQVIPTHDAILSELGKNQVDKYWPIHCEKINATYIRPAEPLEV